MQPEEIALLISVAAITVSIGALILQYRLWRQSGPVLSSWIAQGPHGVALDITNSGREATKIRSWHIGNLSPEDADIGPGLPAPIEPGDTLRWKIPDAEIKNKLFGTNCFESPNEMIVLRAKIFYNNTSSKSKPLNVSRDWSSHISERLKSVHDTPWEMLIFTFYGYPLLNVRKGIDFLTIPRFPSIWTALRTRTVKSVENDILCMKFYGWGRNVSARFISDTPITRKVTGPVRRKRFLAAPLHGWFKLTRYWKIDMPEMVIEAAAEQNIWCLIRWKGIKHEHEKKVKILSKDEFLAENASTEKWIEEYQSRRRYLRRRPR